ncbi:MAG: hypothetical protein M1434_15680, partial [Chloroflexi bacterium]|nr:hypothetical protein [Chloroflexota bacterium]
AEGVLGRLVSLREQIIQGDYRMLYLAWLKAKMFYEFDGVEDGEVEEDEPEPPVPAGLRKLTAGLKTFMTLFEIDPNLVKAAAESSDALEPISDEALASALASLPRQECDAFLLRVLQNEPQVGRDLRKRLIELAGLEKPASSQRSRRPSALMDTAKRYEQEERRREQAEAERQRIRELEELSQREEPTWTWVDRLLEQRAAKPYDEAVALLVKLRDLAAYQNRLPAFEIRFAAMANRCTGRRSLMERFRRVGLVR